MIQKPLFLSDMLTQGTISVKGGQAVATNAAPINRANRTLEALDASVTLNIDGWSSSANIRLPIGTKVDGRCYIEMFTIQGSAGVFRTRSPQVGYGGEYTNIQLEHAINEMGDFIIPATIEKEYDLKPALKKIFEYYNKKSLVWKLKDVEQPKDPEADVGATPDKCVLDVDYDNCLEALRGVMEQYPYMYLDFNFKTRPFQLNVRNRPTTVSAEGRLTRNVKSAVVTRDDSELYTRVYLDKLKENKDENGIGHHTNTYAKKKYGLIETMITGANDTDKIAERTVKSFLRTHKKPRYTVSIDGIELSSLTGEKLDKLTVGKLMRLALPDYGETVTEHITEVSFPAIYLQPNAVSVTLNDPADSVIKYIKKAQRSASRAGKAAGKANKNAYIDAKISKDGLTLTLTKGDGSKVTFSKAVTLYKDKAHDAGWSNGTFRVAAYSSNFVDEKQVETFMKAINTRITDISAGSVSVSGKYSISVPLTIKTAVDGETGFSKTLKISGLTVYRNGWRAAYDTVKMPKGGTSSSMTVEVPAYNVDKKSTFDYTVSADNAYAYIKNAVGTTVARVSHNVYQNGWRAAQDEVIMPSFNFSQDMDVIVPAYNVGLHSTYTYTVSADDDYAYIKNAVGTTVARASNPAYGHGYTEGTGDGWDLARTFLHNPAYSTDDNFEVGIPASTYNQGSSYNFALSLSDDSKKFQVRDATNKLVGQLNNTTYDVSQNELSWSGVGNRPTSAGTPGGTRIGRVASVQGASYVSFSVSVRGDTYSYYIELY